MCKEEITTIEQLKWAIFCVLDDCFKCVSKTLVVRFHDGERYKIKIELED